MLYTPRSIPNTKSRAVELTQLWYTRGYTPKQACVHIGFYLKQTWTYFTIFVGFVKHFCTGSQEPNAQRIQNHPLAPLNNTICQVSHVQAMDHFGKAFCDGL